MLRTPLRAVRWRLVSIALALGAFLTAGLPARAASLESAVAEVLVVTPTAGAGFENVAFDRLTPAAQYVEYAAATLLGSIPSASPHDAAPLAQRFLSAKRQVDQRLDAVFALGPAAAQAALGQSDVARQRQTLRNYLRVANQLIDLSGRLRYIEFDILREAQARVTDGGPEAEEPTPRIGRRRGRSAAQVAENPANAQALIDALVRYRSDVGAIQLANMAFDPDGVGASLPGPTLAALRSRALELIAASGESEVLPQLAAYIRRAPGSWLTVQTAETIRIIGLPQDIRPGQDPTLPAPAITAGQLRAAVARVTPGSLPPAWETRRKELMTWLDGRIAHGVPEDATMSIGCCSVRAGDWLLMRNPSPYNLFTDLAPGLFTHVGVVAWEKGSDGRGRLVLVDLPERGSSIPATNVETFVLRSRHFVFLRHRDPETAKRMGQAAASVIGNPSQFDLNFRTDRVLELVGQPLAGKKIHTYCAGLLLLCGLAAERPREELFPVSESCAPGLTAENLRTLGMSLGEDFVSPSGALYSPAMQVSGRKPPTYNDDREVQEAVFDYFAAKLATTPLRVSQDLFQSLRSKVAAAAKGNALLAQALAKAVNVSSDVDLVAAARAAAVVETLDDVAYGASGQYLDAKAAIRGSDSVDPAKAQRYRQIHSSLYSRFSQGQLHPRMLRVELVQYYTQWGRQQIDRRFFLPPAAPSK